MAAKKKGGKVAPRPRSGFVTEEQRKTERITLRLDPDTMARLRDFAAEHGWSVSESVTEAFKALERELEAQLAASQEALGAKLTDLRLARERIEDLESAARALVADAMDVDIFCGVKSKHVRALQALVTVLSNTEESKP